MDKVKLDRLNLSSADGIQLNMEALYRIAPSVFTEARDPKTGEVSRKVNFEALRQLLGDNAVDGDGESYQFTWVGKNAAKAEAARPTDKTLRPVPEDSVDWDNTQNLYIEGDNLEVLKLLQRSYLGKVKMIYIDPPYNTGNDFVYDDDFARTATEEDLEAGNVDELGYRYRKNTDSNGKFHSDWCSMIYPRLLVARSLLTEDGAIFISIGEEEYYNLRKICNEVFGADNFRNSFITRRYDKNLNRQFMDNGLQSFNVGFEYIVCYSNSNFLFSPVFREAPEERQSSGYWKGFWNDADRPTMRYDILGFTPEVGQWKWKKEVAQEAVKNYIEYEDKFSSKMSLEDYWIATGRTKKFIRRNPNGKGKNAGVENWIAPSDTILRNTNWLDLLASKKDDTTQNLFDYPKNVDVLKLILQTASDKNSIILDFFSGSATTAHAVMQLNAEDEGNRKFIMVQLPEEIPEDSEGRKAGYQTIPEIGKERIRRAGKKIKEESPLKTQNLDTGFRVFRLDESNYEEVSKSPKDYEQDTLGLFANNIKADRTDLDLLFGAMLAWGVTLDLPMTSETVDGCTIYTVNNGDLVVCFSESITNNVVKAMAAKMPLRVLFRDSCFTQDAQKINIYEQFKQLMHWADDEAFKNIKVI